MKFVTDRSKKISRGMGNMGWRRESSKVRSRGKKASTKTFPQVDPGLWKEGQWMNAHEKTMELCHWHEGRVCAEKEKGVFTVKGEERRGAQVHFRTIEKRVQ